MGSLRQMFRARFAGRVAAAAAVTGLLLTEPVLSAAPSAAAVADIPVVGTTSIAVSSSATARVQVLVHGVRRVPGGTVLYYSLGAPAGSQVALSQLSQPNQQARFPLRGQRTGTNFLIDGASSTVYESLVDAQDNTLSSPLSAWPQQGGTFYVLYQAFPELPAGVGFVDVQVGHGDVATHVPVQSGPLQPAVSGDRPIALGAGWPAVDTAAIGSSVQPAKSIHPLQTVSSDKDKTVTTRQEPKKVTVDLASDVLFAVDSATLSSRAQAQVAKAVATINARAAAGQVQVVGHTDSTASDSYNLDLSRRRAAAVLAAVKPKVTVSGVTFSAQGRGESDPVESNSSSEGRAANRRVSIVFTPKSAS